MKADTIFVADHGVPVKCDLPIRNECERICKLGDPCFTINLRLSQGIREDLLLYVGSGNGSQRIPVPCSDNVKEGLNKLSVRHGGLNTVKLLRPSGLGLIYSTHLKYIYA